MAYAIERKVEPARFAQETLNSLGRRVLALGASKARPAKKGGRK